MELLEDVWELERTIDPGLPMDTYLVCNGSYPSEYRAFFRQIDGAKTPGGIMHVLSRPNIGLSFGAYAHAFQKLHDTYGYWLFAEDDVIQIRSGYLPAYHDALRDHNVGFIATVGVAGYHDEKHVHGGCGFTTGEILDRVAEQYDGMLPYANKEPDMAKGQRSGNPVFDHGAFCNEGEVPLTNTIIKMGYAFRLMNAYTEAYYAWKYEDGSDAPQTSLP